MLGSVYPLYLPGQGEDSFRALPQTVSEREEACPLTSKNGPAEQTRPNEPPPTAGTSRASVALIGTPAAVDSGPGPAYPARLPPAHPMSLIPRTLALALLLAFALPVRAQRTADLPGRQAPVALSETPATLSLGTLFNAETLDFSQSVEASYGSGYGGSVGLGMYTASLRWQPSARLAARVDVSAARTLFGSGIGDGLGLEPGQDTRVFLRNAEIAYRPTENSVIHLQVSQSPYGSYAAPYGAGYGLSRYGSRYGAGQSARLRVGGSDGLFFRDGR